MKKLGNYHNLEGLNSITFMLPDHLKNQPIEEIPTLLLNELLELPNIGRKRAEYLVGLFCNNMWETFLYFLMEHPEKLMEIHASKKIAGLYIFSGDLGTESGYISTLYSNLFPELYKRGQDRSRFNGATIIPLQQWASSFYDSSQLKSPSKNWLGGNLHSLPNLKRYLSP